MLATFRDYSRIFFEICVNGLQKKDLIETTHQKNINLYTKNTSKFCYFK